MHMFHSGPFSTLSNKVNDGVSWYQHKIGMYDKQLWEQSVESKVLQTIENFPKKTAKVKAELIDVDLVRGSTFPKAKPQHGWLEVSRKGMWRLIFFPIYYDWWCRQTSRWFAALLLLMYAMQVGTLVVYYTDTDNKLSAEHLSLAHLISPIVMIILLGLIHAQIIATTESHRLRRSPSEYRRDTKTKKKDSSPKYRNKSSGNSSHDTGVETNVEEGSSTSCPHQRGLVKNVKFKRRSLSASLEESGQSKLADGNCGKAKYSPTANDGDADDESDDMQHFVKVSKLNKSVQACACSQAGTSHIFEQSDSKELSTCAGMTEDITSHSPLQYKCDSSDGSQTDIMCHSMETKQMLSQPISDFDGELISVAGINNIPSQDANPESAVLRSSNWNGCADEHPLKSFTMPNINCNLLQDHETQPTADLYHANSQKTEVQLTDGACYTTAACQADLSPLSVPHGALHCTENTCREKHCQMPPRTLNVERQQDTRLPRAGISSCESDGERSPHFQASPKLQSSEPEWEDTVNTEMTSCTDTSSRCTSDTDSTGKELMAEDSHVGSVTSIQHVASVMKNLAASTDKVSCTIWEGEDLKKLDLTVLDIGSTIIQKVEKIPEKCDYLMFGLVVSTILTVMPVAFRLYYTKDKWESSTMSTLAYQGRSLFFGESWREMVVVCNGIVQRACLSLVFFFLLSVAERTFKQRLLYAKHFCYLTSSRRAKKYELPHFRLNKVRNIKTWLSLRSYLKKRGPQRSVDTIISAAFILAVSLVSILCIELLQDSGSFLDHLGNWELVLWCMALGIYLLQFMTLGSKVNRKYRNFSVLITEQINLYLHMEQKPHKKEELMLANSVLKLAEDLLRELESPFKVSGLSANPFLYNITKVIILSAFSAVLTELLGFKLKLYKIKIRT